MQYLWDAPKLNHEIPMAKYHCSGCFMPYDEELGLPDEGIPPGTKWADVPDSFECPECGNVKSGFQTTRE